MNLAFQKNTHCHSIDDCTTFIVAKNPQESTRIIVLLKTLVTSGIDRFLYTFTCLILREEIPLILSFLRTFEVLDVWDCECIINNNKHQTTEQEITALVDELNKKGPHAFWYLAHSLEHGHPDLFTEMHGKIICCVCKEVREYHSQLFRSGLQKGIVLEKPSFATECPLIAFKPSDLEKLSIGNPRQNEVLRELMARVEQLRMSFCCLEDRFTQVFDTMKPLHGMVGNISQRVRDEIQDVITHTQPHERLSGEHTQFKVIRRLRAKYQQLRGIIEEKLHRRPSATLTGTDENKNLKAIVCKEPSSLKNVHEVTASHSYYDELWIHFEDRFAERLSQFNPMPMLQRSVENVILNGHYYSTRVACVFGVAVCIRIVGSFMIEYGSSSNAPRPLFT